MIPPLDPFAQEFDAIDVDPARAPARDAIESAMSLVAPQDELLTASAAAPEFASPGFYLLQDAGGRFVVDRDMGVVTLADEALLEREHGAVHGVRLRVVEQSGAVYELEMQLRITGHVPQMVGAEEFASIAGSADDAALAPLRMPALIVPAQAAAPAMAPVVAATAQIAWTRFAAVEGHAARLPRVQPRRGFITPELPVTEIELSLEFEGPPPPFASHVPWSL